MRLDELSTVITEDETSSVQVNEFGRQTIALSMADLYDMTLQSYPTITDPETGRQIVPPGFTEKRVYGIGIPDGDGKVEPGSIHPRMVQAYDSWVAGGKNPGLLLDEDGELRPYDENWYLVDTAWRLGGAALGLADDISKAGAYGFDAAYEGGENVTQLLWNGLLDTRYVGSALRYVGADKWEDAPYDKQGAGALSWLTSDETTLGKWSKALENRTDLSYRDQGDAFAGAVNSWQDLLGLFIGGDSQAALSWAGFGAMYATELPSTILDYGIQAAGAATGGPMGFAIANGVLMSFNGAEASGAAIVQIKEAIDSSYESGDLQKTDQWRWAMELSREQLVYQGDVPESSETLSEMQIAQQEALAREIIETNTYNSAVWKVAATAATLDTASDKLIFGKMTLPSPINPIAQAKWAAKSIGGIGFEATEEGLQELWVQKGLTDESGVYSYDVSQIINAAWQGGVIAGAEVGTASAIDTLTTLAGSLTKNDQISSKDQKAAQAMFRQMIFGSDAGDLRKMFDVIKLDTNMLRNNVLNAEGRLALAQRVRDRGLILDRDQKDEDGNFILSRLQRLRVRAGGTVELEDGQRVSNDIIEENNRNLGLMEVIDSMTYNEKFNRYDVDFESEEEVYKAAELLGIDIDKEGLGFLDTVSATAGGKRRLNRVMKDLEEIYKLDIRIQQRSDLEAPSWVDLTPAQRADYVNLGYVDFSENSTNGSRLGQRWTRDDIDATTQREGNWDQVPDEVKNVAEPTDARPTLQGEGNTLMRARQSAVDALESFKTQAERQLAQKQTAWDRRYGDDPDNAPRPRPDETDDDYQRNMSVYNGQAGPGVALRQRIDQIDSDLREAQAAWDADYGRTHNRNGTPRITAGALATLDGNVRPTAAEVAADNQADADAEQDQDSADFGDEFDTTITPDDLTGDDAPEQGDDLEAAPQQAPVGTDLARGITVFNTQYRIAAGDMSPEVLESTLANLEKTYPGITQEILPKGIDSYRQNPQQTQEEIAENPPVEPPAQPATKPKAGAEVTIDTQKYVFLGQMWAPVKPNGDLGSTGSVSSDLQKQLTDQALERAIPTQLSPIQVKPEDAPEYVNPNRPDVMDQIDNLPDVSTYEKGSTVEYRNAKGETREAEVVRPLPNGNLQVTLNGATYAITPANIAAAQVPPVGSNVDAQLTAPVQPAVGNTTDDGIPNDTGADTAPEVPNRPDALELPSQPQTGAPDVDTSTPDEPTGPTAQTTAPGQPTTDDGEVNDTGAEPTTTQDDDPPVPQQRPDAPTDTSTPPPVPQVRPEPPETGSGRGDGDAEAARRAADAEAREQRRQQAQLKQAELMRQARERMAAAEREAEERAKAQAAADAKAAAAAQQADDTSADVPDFATPDSSVPNSALDRRVFTNNDGDFNTTNANLDRSMPYVIQPVVGARDEDGNVQVGKVYGDTEQLARAYPGAKVYGAPTTITQPSIPSTSQDAAQRAAAQQAERDKAQAAADQRAAQQAEIDAQIAQQQADQQVTPADMDTLQTQIPVDPRVTTTVPLTTMPAATTATTQIKPTKKGDKSPKLRAPGVPFTGAGNRSKTPFNPNPKIFGTGAPDYLDLMGYKSFGKGSAAESVIKESVNTERKMTKKEKSKEERLKDKYDDSGMKASMKKQYGKDWKSVYYATIRKKAMSKKTEGYSILPSIDRNKYQTRQGLEGPFQTKAGKVVYYDPKEGSYYDPDTDMYLTYDEWKKLDEFKQGEPGMGNLYVNPNRPPSSRQAPIATAPQPSAPKQYMDRLSRMAQQSGSYDDSFAPQAPRDPQEFEPYVEPSYELELPDGLQQKMDDILGKQPEPRGPRNIDDILRDLDRQYGTGDEFMPRDEDDISNPRPPRDPSSFGPGGQPIPDPTPDPAPYSELPDPMDDLLGADDGDITPPDPEPSQDPNPSGDDGATDMEGEGKPGPDDFEQERYLDDKGTTSNVGVKGARGNKEFAIATVGGKETKVYGDRETLRAKYPDAPIFNADGTNESITMDARNRANSIFERAIQEFEFNPRAGHMDQPSHPQNRGLTKQKSGAPKTSIRPRMRPKDLELKMAIDAALRQAMGEGKLTEEEYSWWEKFLGKDKAKNNPFRDSDGKPLSLGARSWPEPGEYEDPEGFRAGKYADYDMSDLPPTKTIGGRSMMPTMSPADFDSVDNKDYTKPLDPYQGVEPWMSHGGPTGKKRKTPEGFDSMVEGVIDDLRRWNRERRRRENVKGYANPSVVIPSIEDPERMLDLPGVKLDRIGQKFDGADDPYYQDSQYSMDLQTHADDILRRQYPDGPPSDPDELERYGLARAAAYRKAQSGGTGYPPEKRTKDGYVVDQKPVGEGKYGKKKKKKKSKYQEHIDRIMRINENVSMMRKIVADKSALPVKFKDSTMKVDMTTANIFLQVFDQQKPDTQAKIIDKIETKNGFLKILDIIYDRLK